jgi:hypothetical protein
MDQKDESFRAYMHVIRECGTPKQLAEKLASIDALIREHERRRWLFSSIKVAAMWAAAVAAGWVAFKTVIVELLQGVVK